MNNLIAVRTVAWKIILRLQPGEERRFLWRGIFVSLAHRGSWYSGEVGGIPLIAGTPDQARMVMVRLLLRELENGKEED